MKRINPVESFHAHPPERKRRSTTLMVHGCCCCCCLHSVGGVAGSIWGSLRRNAPDPDTLNTPEAIRNEDELRTAHRLAVKVYWLCLTILFTLSLAISMFAGFPDRLVGPFLVVMGVPAGQLVASLAAWIWIAAKPPVRKSECLRRLARITLFGFLGGLAGVVGVVITFLTLRL